jgi:hypothetical protein
MESIDAVRDEDCVADIIFPDDDPLVDGDEDLSLIGGNDSLMIDTSCASSQGKFTIGGASSLASEASGELAYDMEWIRENAGSKVGLIEGFSTKEDGEVGTEIGSFYGYGGDGDCDDDEQDNVGMEDALNAECERLRERLSAKMVYIAPNDY